MSIRLADRGNNILIQSLDSSPGLDHIPPYIYRIALSDDGIVLIKDRKKFETPTKYYGDTEKQRDVIVEEWKETKDSLGVLLSGLKGAGKSLLAESIANKLLELDIPVFYLDSFLPPQVPFHVARIAGPCLIIFEEFGKVYDKDDQNRMVNSFSDTNYNKVMFIITANGEDPMNVNFHHRPGRFLFSINYSSIPLKVISSIVDDQNLPEEISDYIKLWCYKSRNPVTFDIITKVCKMAKGCQDTKELMSLMTMLNVPIPLYVRYVVTDIYLGTDDSVLELKTNAMDNYIDYEVTNGTEIILMGKLTVDDIYNNRSYKGYMTNGMSKVLSTLIGDSIVKVKLSDEISIIINCTVSEFSINDYNTEPSFINGHIVMKEEIGDIMHRRRIKGELDKVNDGNTVVVSDGLNTAHQLSPIPLPDYNNRWLGEGNGRGSGGVVFGETDVGSQPNSTYPPAAVNYPTLPMIHSGNSFNIGNFKTGRQ